MKIVHSWLNELAPVGDDVDAVASVITNLGIAVEDIVHIGGAVAGVITAKVLRTERHPDAAKVHRVYVDAGDGRERHVWCGAFNMQAGDIVPLATPGTAMPDGRVIEPKPILGIQSDGMLCSPRELGLGDDHAGIVILPADAPLGVPYGEALGLAEETVYDLDVTRNLPDCYGHLGVARDLAAKLGLALTCRPSTRDARRCATSSHGHRRAGRRRSLCPLHERGTQRHRCHLVARLDRPAPRRCGHATDQQRGRRQQLRDARAQPAQPRLRLRHVGRCRLPSAAGT